MIHKNDPKDRFDEHEFYPEIKIKQYDLNEIDGYDIDGVDSKDYPDFCDTHFCYAITKDGHELTDDELEVLTEAYPELISEYAMEHCVGEAEFRADAKKYEEDR